MFISAKPADILKFLIEIIFKTVKGNIYDAEFCGSKLCAFHTRACVLKYQ